MDSYFLIRMLITMKVVRLFINSYTFMHSYKNWAWYFFLFLNPSLQLICFQQHRVRSAFEDYSPMQHVLDRAKVQYGGKFLDKDVDDVKALVGLLPTLAFLIIYCSCYYMVGIFFFFLLFSCF